LEESHDDERKRKESHLEKRKEKENPIFKDFASFATCGSLIMFMREALDMVSGLWWTKKQKDKKKDFERGPTPDICSENGTENASQDEIANVK
jgi:hypothetical protein